MVAKVPTKMDGKDFWERQMWDRSAAPLVPFCGHLGPQAGRPHSFISTDNGPNHPSASLFPKIVAEMETSSSQIPFGLKFMGRKDVGWSAQIFKCE
jgi:hypothetical protein